MISDLSFDSAGNGMTLFLVTGVDYPGIGRTLCQTLFHDPSTSPPLSRCYREVSQAAADRRACEPVWPSGKISRRALARSLSALLSLEKGWGLWTQSCDFVPHN